MRVLFQSQSWSTSHRTAPHCNAAGSKWARNRAVLSPCASGLPSTSYASYAYVFCCTALHLSAGRASLRSKQSKQTAWAIRSSGSPHEFAADVGAWVQKAEAPHGRPGPSPGSPIGLCHGLLLAAAYVLGHRRPPAPPWVLGSGIGHVPWSWSVARCALRVRRNHLMRMRGD